MRQVPFGRRGLLKAGLAGSLAVASASSVQGSGQASGMTLDEALRLRRSTRSFRSEPIDETMALDLAWAGLGVNRPESGLRTAPSWRGAADTRMHLASAAGVQIYDPTVHGFTPVLPADIRKDLSPQPFVATAPLVLVYTSDVAAMPSDAPEADKTIAARIDAAIVAQNVYLFCASRGLGTCLVGGINAASALAALGLSGVQIVTFVQPVGWPA